MFKNLKTKIASGVALVGVGITSASADLVTDTLTALTGAKTDALSVGSAVVGLVAGLIVVTLIIGIVKKS